MLRAIATAALVLGLTACGQGPDTADHAGHADTGVPATESTVNFESDSFIVENAWVRQPLMGQTTTAAYLTLTSRLSSNSRILAVYADKAETAELHTHSLEGGAMRMRKVEGIDIGAGETSELRQLDNHIMLFNVEEGLVAGDTVTLTLDIFHDATTERLTFEVPVRALG